MGGASHSTLWLIAVGADVWEQDESCLEGPHSIPPVGHSVCACVCEKDHGVYMYMAWYFRGAALRGGGRGG